MNGERGVAMDKRDVEGIKRDVEEIGFVAGYREIGVVDGDDGIVWRAVDLE